MIEKQYVYRKAAIHLSASKTIKCPFCDFSCPSRGMNNHVAKVHGIKKIEEKISVISSPAVVTPPKKITDKSSVRRDSLGNIEGWTVVDQEQVMSEKYYMPICVHCEGKLNNGAWESYERGSKKRNNEWIPEGEFKATGDFLCNKCIAWGRSAGEEKIKDGTMKFVKVDYSRVIASKIK